MLVLPFTVLDRTTSPMAFITEMEVNSVVSIMNSALNGFGYTFKPLAAPLTATPVPFVWSVFLTDVKTGLLNSDPKSRI